MGSTGKRKKKGECDPKQGELGAKRERKWKAQRSYNAHIVKTAPTSYLRRLREIKIKRAKAGSRKRPKEKFE